MSERIENLILKKFLGTITPQEAAELQAWLDATPNNHLLYDQYKRAWSSRVEEAVDTAVVQEKIAERDRPRLRRKGRRWMPIADGIALALIAVASYFIYDALKEQPQIFRSGKAIETFYLSDSTEVTLKPNSLLLVSKDFEEGLREVMLEGQAFFRVKKHEGNQSFAVVGTKSRTEVLGTTFMVKSDKETGRDEVTVVEGKVRMNVFDDPERVVIIEPGNKGITDESPNGLVVRPVNTENTAAWKEKKLVFRDTPLEHVIPVLEEYFGVKINVENETLLNCKLTRTFNKPSFDEVLAQLRLSHNIVALREYSQYTFQGKGCKK